MPPIPTGSMALAPVPTELRPFPWRFSLGDEVYVLGRPSDSTYKVVGGELWMGFPHLHAVGPAGKTWRFPQIHCSSRPIEYRKG